MSPVQGEESEAAGDEPRHACLCQMPRLAAGRGEPDSAESFRTADIFNRNLATEFTPL